MLAVSNVGYIIFNFLNLNAGWIHRIDNGHVKRPWKAPTGCSPSAPCSPSSTPSCLGAGADVWGAGTLWAGIDHLALIVPVFVFRHYVQDKGKFPDGHARGSVTRR